MERVAPSPSNTGATFRFRSATARAPVARATALAPRSAFKPRREDRGLHDELRQLGQIEDGGDDGDAR